MFREHRPLQAQQVPASTIRTSSRQNKEIEDKIPTITIANFTEIDGGPYPVLVARSDPHGLRHDDLGQGPAHVQGRRRVRVLGRGRLRPDQRPADSRQHQQPERPRSQFSNSSAGADRRRQWPTRRWACSTTTPRSASARSRSGGRSATDMFVQDSWKPSSNLTVEGGVRYVLWPPWYSTDEQHRELRSARSTAPANQAVINPANGRIVSGPRYNGIVLPGDGFPAIGEQPRRLQRPGGAGAVPRRAARLRRDAQERVRAARRHVLRGQREDHRPRRAPACSTTASR